MLKVLNAKVTCDKLIHVQVTLLLCCHAFVWAPIEYARTKHVETMWIGGSGSFVKHQQHTLILCRHHNNFPLVLCFPHVSLYIPAYKFMVQRSWPSKNSHLLGRGWGGGVPYKGMQVRGSLSPSCGEFFLPNIDSLTSPYQGKWVLSGSFS